MKKVVIIGGGFSGVTIAKKLQKKFKTTLIDSKEYFEFTPSILKTIVNPNYIHKIQFLYKNFLKNTKIIIGSPKKISRKFIKIKNQKINFDFLVICTGSSYSSPIKRINVIKANRATNLKNHYEKFKKNKKILIIGGGLVGIELAAEIITKFQDKEIILIHSEKKLIPRNSKKSSDYAKEFLEKKGVKIILNEKIIKNKKNTFFSNTGKEYNADLTFLCTGIKPNSKLIEKNFPKKLDIKKQIIVNKYLQLENHKNIFAAGDINNTPTEKTAQNAILQAKVTAQNILNLSKNKQLKAYKPKTTIIAISLGRWNGIIEFPQFIITGIIAGLIKQIVEFKERLKYL